MMIKKVTDPAIHQAASIVGRSIKLRNVKPDDAGFIVDLRTNEKKGRFISSTSQDINEQKQWIKRYLSSEGQAYFIIEDFNGHPYGTVRMYDQQENSFCWGSWVISAEAPAHFAIESALLIYQYALSLGFERAHFDVRKGNLSVIKFHERFGAERTDETELDIHYSLSKENILSALEKFKKYLPDHILINQV
ncbi:GNAT family N-acetyltransferase [Enterobacter sp.]|uniref:GNAT family N-acetyltransferase n=1 Tax=Enterobacter sp. TaxID=42895 RepID=UPI00296F02A8|nr:GNAT family N-acetyltransferase [Enterobacter sp.]